MNRLLNASAFFAACSLAHLSVADVIDTFWVGPTGGNWHVGENWDPVVPNNVGLLFHAHIDFPGVVNLAPSDATVSNLTLGSRSTLSINNSRTLHIANDGNGTGLVNNGGLLRIDSAGSTTMLRLTGGPVTFTGGGTVLLLHPASHFRADGPDGGAIINMDNTIRGRGNFGSGTASQKFHSVINEGWIIADNDTSPLLVHGPTLAFTNVGVLRAQNDATLQLNIGTYVNHGGVIEALAGAQVSLNGAVLITGGELLTEDDGILRVTGSTPRLTDLTVAGHLHVNNAGNLDVTDVTMDGSTVVIGSAGSTTTLRPIEGTLTLTGGGNVLMTHAVSHIRGVSSLGGSLVNVDNTIRGAGNLSSATLSQKLNSIVNHQNGLIVADASSPLTIHGTNLPSTSLGILRAQDGGTLALVGGDFANVEGLIEALPGSEVSINGVFMDSTGSLIKADAGAEISLSGNATIVGGEIRAINDGVNPGLVRITASTPRLVDVTISGDFHLNNATTLELSDVSMEETTNIVIGSAGSTTVLRLTDGPVAFTGGGTVLLTHASSHIRGDGGGGSLVNVDTTIRGMGNVGSSTVSQRLDSLINQHAIVADGASLLTIHATNTALTNTGVLQAQDGATLVLNAGQYENDGGTIVALADSEVRLAGTTIITGGELTTEDDGVVRITGSTPRFSDLANSGHVHLNNSQHLELSGTIENSGVISVNSAGSTTIVRAVDGLVTLTGGGDVVLSSHAANHIRGTGAGSSLLNIDNTIRGAGNLSSATVSQQLDIINQGTIIADSTVALNVNGHSPNGFLNEGLIEVTGTGGLASTGGTFANAGQIIVHDDRAISRTGDLVQTDGATTVNGTLTVTNGSLQLQGGSLIGGGQVNGAVNNTGGRVAPGNPGNPENPGDSIGLLTIAGNLAQAAGGRVTIEIAGLEPIDDHDQLHVTGTATLGGRLELVFDESFSPQVGDAFLVLTAGTRLGTFASVAPCEAIRVLYDDDDVLVEYTGQTKIGDLNCDGVVGVADLLILLSAWGDCPDPADCPADLTDSGAVGVADLLVLLANWG